MLSLSVIICALGAVRDLSAPDFDPEVEVSQKTRKRQLRLPEDISHTLARTHTAKTHTHSGRSWDVKKSHVNSTKCCYISLFRSLTPSRLKNPRNVPGCSRRVLGIPRPGQDLHFHVDIICFFWTMQLADLSVDRAYFLNTHSVSHSHCGARTV